MAVFLPRLPFWVWWIPVIWVVSFPVAPTVVPQWHRAHAIPFTDPQDKVTDLAINLLLFAPFGYSFFRSRRNVALLIAATAGTSISAELLQLFSTARNPSGTDVVYAILGAVSGAAAALAVSRPRG